MQAVLSHILSLRIPFGMSYGEGVAYFTLGDVDVVRYLGYPANTVLTIDSVIYIIEVPLDEN